MDGLGFFNSCQAPPETVMPAAQQLSLFPYIIRSAHLAASDSPKKAFYRLWIKANAGLFAVLKESGANGRVLDRRRWPVETFDPAVKMVDRIITSKTNPERKSPRKYRLINSAHND